MNLPKDDAATLSARWTEGVLLKRDVFSTVERGRFRGDNSEVDAVLRRLERCRGGHSLWRAICSLAKSMRWCSPRG